MMIHHFSFKPQARLSAVTAAVSAMMVFLAGCGTSTPSEQTSSPSEQTSSPPLTSEQPPASAEKASGKVDSVKGSTVVVLAKDGPVTVDFTPSTRIVQIDPAQLTDVGPGGCVDVRRAPGEPGRAPAPARSVTLSAPSKSGCPRSNDEKGLRGTVISVTGQTFTVADSSTALAAVQVDAKTKYFKQATVGVEAIKAGVCLTAVGSPADAVLQASRATVKPAVDGECP